jgi:hypothetical protein
MGPCNCWSLLCRRSKVEIGNIPPPVHNPCRPTWSAPAQTPLPAPEDREEDKSALEDKKLQLQVTAPSRTSLQNPTPVRSLQSPTPVRSLQSPTPIRPALRAHFQQSSNSEFSQSSHPVSQRDLHTVAGEIWVSAYKAIQEDESLQPLVENYELFFNAVLWPKRTSQTQESIRTSECLLCVLPASFEFI